jgi:ferric-dicitrate binding protein FerR (iron transport regulator)
MGLSYQHTEPADARRTAVAILLGFILGCLLTATLLTTWHDAAAIEQTYTTNSRTYTIRTFEDGSPLIEVNGQRMYLTATPQHEGK